ncbi:MAG: CopD family protein [Nitrososphaerota archaeon]|nr:CopD family protein [Nitrososphaerota archaeon]
MSVLDIVVLWVHLLSAVLFVGGSFFMWLVVVPASHLIARDESERTQLVGKIAKQFGRVTSVILIVLVLSGVYNVSWYLPSFGALFSYPGTILLAKVILVVALILLIYLHNTYFGRKIVQFAREGKLEQLKAIRKKSRVVSMANLLLMLVILLLAVMLQMPL